MSLAKRLFNAKHDRQGTIRKVLCVCSAGLLRSPTAAVVLSQPPFNFNTRAAGLVPEFALIVVDQVLLEWCDEIVCMEKFHKETLELLMELPDYAKRPIKCLEIEDNFSYRSSELIFLIANKYREVSR